jgi:hypothetical protein
MARNLKDNKDGKRKFTSASNQGFCNPVRVWAKSPELSLERRGPELY